ncbi:MAG: hypothetical protein IH850_01595 [Acidobacteria bacterium]|nr:hypothetical protein [Acidobacteriota bacterium]
MREWVLLGHVLFAIIWMGGSVYVEALTANAKRRSDPIALGVLFRDTSAMNQRLFAVTSSLTIAFGFWLIFIGPVSASRCCGSSSASCWWAPR